MTYRVMLVTTLLLALAVSLPAAAAQDEVVEVAVTFIELAGPAAERDAEISGLAWYGDFLVLLTENPFLYADDTSAGALFALEKQAILNYLQTPGSAPLEPFPVPIYGPDIFDTVSGFEVAFDGFESIAFVPSPYAFADDLVFLTIEAETVSVEDTTMRGYLVWGTVEPGLTGIHLRLDDYIDLPRQTDFDNMSYESLFVADGQVIALYEINGAGVNPSPLAYSVDLATGEVTAIPVDNVEFRITDVTAPDANGLMWAINYFFVGESFLAVETDPVFERYGMGASQATFDGYERLIALQYTGDAVELVETAPIQLLMTEDSRGRNWEGIVGLDDLGFLIVTDRFPRTLLGFVPTAAEQPQPAGG